MVLSFIVAMAVAFAIDRTTKFIEKLTLVSSKPIEIRRAKSIRKIAKKEMHRKKREYERRCHVEVIDHYYGEGLSDNGNNDLVTHFYPKK